MIVSHRHRFVFFAVPRTATHSVRGALRLRLTPEDWEQQRLTAEQSLPIPALAGIGHGHVTLTEARAHLPAHVMRDYFKFAFVRDPFTRFLSACNFLNRGNADYARDPRSVIHALIRRPRFRQRVLIRPQSAMLTDADGRLGLDYVGRFERLDADYAEVCRRIGLPVAGLQATNAAPDGASLMVYDQTLAQWVVQFYARDFDLFDYSTELDRWN